MNDRELLQSLVDSLPEKELPKAISRIITINDKDFNKKKFDIANNYIIKKYHVAYEELAK